jgi:3-deoxy-D-manno-octulosonic-acid transferase
MIVLVELEVWHNLVRMASQRGIPVIIVNGRLTERSARRLARLGRPIRSMFGDLAWVGAQDEEIASRFRALGVPADRVEITSSLKWDSATLVDWVDGSDELASALKIDRTRPLWVCGSTGPGEEQLILDAYRRLLEGWSSLAWSVQEESAEGRIPPEPVLAIVPRKPERFDEVARIVERAGYLCIRRSTHADHIGPEPPSNRAVILGDTMGELRKFYSLAAVVFVGRSLVPLGGSDPMEVAALGKPIMIGPHTENFELPVSALRSADAIRTTESPEALARQAATILQDRTLAVQLGSAAREVVIKNQGATKRTVDAVVRLFEAAD